MVSLFDGVIAARDDDSVVAQDRAYQNAFPEPEIPERDAGQVIMFFPDYEFKSFG